ncbi:MAG: [Ruminococcus sp.]|nr:[FeFe] hydrogenase H-cluster maturation GTPase HydF [Ruminococcus sp.]
MGLNDVPSSERLHISFFGCRNAGKSSLVNAITGQDLSIVSPEKGTTTDPVQKAMELLPLGPVVIIDTPGFDDSGELGELRVKKTRQILNRTDVAVLVVDNTEGKRPTDKKLIALFRQKEIPYVIAYSKSDIAPKNNCGEKEVSVCAITNTNIDLLKERIVTAANRKPPEKCIIKDLIRAGDLIILVTPIDESAPKGRLILPQQQTIREILDSNAVTVVVRENQLDATLKTIGKRTTSLVVTDSQVFDTVNKIVPPNIPLTSFSILMARRKGFLDTAVISAAAIDQLKDGDKVLISEGCTHHRHCDDIGSVKLPDLLKKYTGADLNIEFTSGRDYPEEISDYKLVIHCGGCMLNEREMAYRRRLTLDADVPFTNYGIAIAHMNGILKRSIQLFPNLLSEFNKNSK